MSKKIYFVTLERIKREFVTLSVSADDMDDAKDRAVTVANSDMGLAGEGIAARPNVELEAYSVAGAIDVSHTSITPMLEA